MIHEPETIVVAEEHLGLLSVGKIRDSELKHKGFNEKSTPISISKTSSEIVSSGIEVQVIPDTPPSSPPVGQYIKYS